MLLVLVAACALRAVRLDGQSLWSDEGISLLRSALPLDVMLREMPVEHLPGYFVLLNGWLRIAGQSDYALRFLSLWPSVLAVALIYRLAVELTAGARRGAWIGLTAALFLATSAFQLWYAQEARMYSWLLAAALASTICFWRLLTRPARQPWRTAAGYVLATTLGVYLHFYGFLIPLAQTLFALGWLLFTRDWRIFGRWVLCGLAVLLLFGAWLPRTLGITEFGGWRDPGNPWSIPWRYLTAFTVGDAMPAPWHQWLPVAYGALALLGVIDWWRQRRAAALLLLTLLLAPLTVIVLMALRNPDFHERYAIALSVPLLLLIAGGVNWPLFARRPAAWRWLLSMGLVLPLVSANGLALSRLYSDETLHKPDFRGAAWRIEQGELPGDVILVDGPDPEKVFLHYYAGPNAVVDLRPLLDADWDQVSATLAAATHGAENAWEVLYFHAPGPVQIWLAVNGWATAPSNHNDIRVVRYGLPGPPLTTTQLGVEVGPALWLERADVSADPLRPGDLLRVSSHWLTRDTAPDYKFSLRLATPTGEVLLARDYVPQNGFAPTPVWIVGQPATDQRGILLPADFPPGQYEVTLRLYDPATGIAVDTVQGQDIVLGEVIVVDGP